MSLYPSNDPEIRFQISFSDGSVPAHPLGHYWRMEIGPGHFGETHGPFATEMEAATNARAYIDERVSSAIERIRSHMPQLSRRMQR